MQPKYNSSRLYFLLSCLVVSSFSQTSLGSEPKKVSCNNHNYGYHDDQGVRHTFEYSLEQDQAGKYQLHYRAFERKDRNDPLVAKTDRVLLSDAYCSFDESDPLVFFCMDIPLDQAETAAGDRASLFQMSRVTTRSIWAAQKPIDLVMYEQLLNSKTLFENYKKEPKAYPELDNVLPNPWGHSKKPWLKNDCKVDL